MLPFEPMPAGHVPRPPNLCPMYCCCARFAVWPKVRAFLEALPPGAVVADVGCGNGKYFGVRRDVFVLGSDRSEGKQGRQGGSKRGWEGQDVHGSLSIGRDAEQRGPEWIESWLYRTVTYSTLGSAGLAHVAARRLGPGPPAERLRADIAVADALRLPYRPGCCDGVLCIAVLHHISSPERRRRLLAELLGLLAPGEEPRWA